MSTLRLIIPTGATSAIGSAVVFGSGPLQWLAVGVVVAAVALAVFVVVVRVVGNDRWSSNAADVLELLVIHRPRQERPARKKKKRRRRQ